MMRLLDYLPRPDLLRDRVVLVTGAGGGIGRAVSVGLAAHGATVVLLGRTVSRLEAVYDAIEAAGGPQPAIYPMDLATAAPGDFTELAARVGDTLGRLDGLLHNAAELGTLTPFHLYEPELWSRVLQVNLHAPVLLTRACFPLLSAAPEASVVFSSAGVGRHGRAYWGAYAVAYAAIEGLVQVLADELEGAGRVRVNSLDPGRVRTALHARAYPGEALDRRPPPETVVPAYLYLLGPDSHSVHGQALSAQAP
jgi:NAD(P)-dependent dehydrogenase (short-subunit alcohol dehydrogenase family)